MRSFVLRLESATQYERVAGVSSFVGEDLSGSFGILAGHARFMTSLVFGLARFRAGGGPWQYLALPGGLLYFVNDVLCINTRHYLRDEDYERISTALQEELLAEEQNLRTMTESLRRMEEEIMRHLWQMRRGGEIR